METQQIKSLRILIASVEGNIEKEDNNLRRAVLKAKLYNYQVTLNKLLFLENECE
jgi:hypothetical protein